MKIGQFDIQSFVERSFRLDGGTMFGIIPKSLWQKVLPADDNNLIPMVTNLFVLTAHGKHFLFDAGLGDTLTEREAKIYGITGESAIESGLASLGLQVDDIDYVLLSHLHTDHAAGALRREGDTFVPRFPRARHVVSRLDWQAALDPDERTSAVYNPERYHALYEAGLVDLIDMATELFPGIRLVPTGGHTEGHYAIEIESDGERLMYYADLFPMSQHLPVAWVPATDLAPRVSMSVKRQVVPRLCEDNVIIAFDHDAAMPFARVRREGRRLVADPA